jgi:asparagine synthase (glutamine-hydrolysing)
MTDAIRHRGPDGEGIFLDGGIGLGHRRLSIIDLDTGNQPMIDRESGNIIAYNGEIYNYLELKEELKTLGYRFRTTSDTEVLLNAYQAWGTQCLEKLNGMWAFALWDKQQDLLFLARDRLGIKPLHYYRNDQQFIFGSEIKSIFAAGIQPTLNTELLDIYLTFGFIPGGRSFFNNINRLPPGHFMIVVNGQIKVSRYWDLPDIDEQAMFTDANMIFEQFEHLLGDAVKIRMRSDVPFGAFLSGGLDSASIVALMSGNSSLPIETFTIGFEEPEFDERSLAADVARKFGTKHHEHVVEPDSFEQALERVAFHYDEPFGDSSAIPTGYVSQMAARNVKMVLTGDGGDEVLSGYPGYQVEKFVSRYKGIPSPLRRILRQFMDWGTDLSRNQARFKFARYQRLLETSEHPFEKRILGKAAWLENGVRDKLLANYKVYPAAEFLDDFMKACPFQDSFYRLMYYNLKLTLPDDMLTKVDRMSMAFSLEARVPFLDYRLVEFMAQVHKNIKLIGIERKSVLRKTVARQLPNSLLTASKRGFVVPLREWFKDEKVADIFRSTVGMTPDLHKGTLNQIFSENQTGQKDYGNVIWMLFLLEKAMAA